MLLSDFDFELPQDLIAQRPLAVRSASRLLYCAADGMHDRMFTDLPDLLRAGDLLVFNDTRVVKARLYGVKQSGGKVEVLVERVLPPEPAPAGPDARSSRALVQLRASHSPKPGSRILFGDDASAAVLGRDGEFFVLEFDAPVLDVLDRLGRLPLPPYIDRAADETDDERYQTVFARAPGAVAAPTAGLHFDADVLDRLNGRRIETGALTLHVGAGTFSPVRVENISEHTMHSERYEISGALSRQIAETRERGGRVVAVGTTALRALESAARSDGGVEAAAGETRIFITPGYRFKVVDALITNFHLPKSTLLMLVSAFAGIDRIREAYRHAIAQRYRFFSYGDAMLLERESARENVGKAHG